MALVLAAAASLLAASTALANQYAVGYTYGSSWGGGYVQMYIQAMYTPDCYSGGHINNTDWVFTNNGTSYWTEVGYTFGYHGACSLTYYWARDNAVDGYADYSLNRIDATGTLHQFEGQEVYNGEYDVYIDGGKVGSDVHGYPWTIEVDTGLEYTSSSSSLVNPVTYLYQQNRTQACCTWNYWSRGYTYNYGSPHSWTWNANYYQGTVS